MSTHPKLALSIGAHPDDIEIGCGGFEVILKDRGYKMIHVIVTDGGAGSLQTSPSELSVRRRDEALAAAADLGVDEVVFLNAPDGLTSYSQELKIELIKVLRKFKPEIVLTHAAQDHFPDHEVVHKLTMAAITGAQGPWYQEAGGSPHMVQTILGYEVWHPLNQYQYAVDISAVLPKKLTALARHFSQTVDIDYVAAVKGLAQYRGATSMRGSHVEVFEVHKIQEII